MLENLNKYLWMILIIFTCCGDDDSNTGRSAVDDERSLYQVTTLTEPFDGSGGLSVDADGFIYVADFGDFINNANGTFVSRINPSTGEVTEFANGLVGPSGNAFSENGSLFQSNIAGNSISEITPEGVVKPFTNQGLSSPVGLAFDKSGNLYVCNCGSASIQKVTSDAVSTRFASSSLLNCPNGLTIDGDGNLYAANFNNGNIIKISPDTEAQVFATIPGNSNAHLVFRDNNIYVLSRGGNRLYRVNLDGEVTLIAGTGSAGNDDGSGDEASFNIPNGIGVSLKGGKIYVVSRVVGSGTPLNPVLVRVIELK